MMDDQVEIGCALGSLEEVAEDESHRPLSDATEPSVRKCASQSRQCDTDLLLLCFSGLMARSMVMVLS